MEKRRMVIYQLLPRLFGNKQSSNIKGGTLAQNGSGKFSAIDEAALAAIADLGATHIWYTGVLEHATCTDYSAYGIVRDSRDVVKGEAGSPYAIKDYYDVDPDLADVVDRRMKEFEALVERTHKQGLKVLIDLVPNHLARQYVSDAAPEGVVDFGAGDRRDLAFHKDNNFYYLPGTRFDSPEAEEQNERWEKEPARATGNDCFKANPGHGDWYETVKLNYGVDFVGDSPEDFDPEPDTWLKMRDVVLYWADKGIDGFRCDMAGMVPIAFWRWMIGEVRRRYPKLLFIAEVYEQELWVASAYFANHPTPESNRHHTGHVAAKAVDAFIGPIQHHVAHLQPGIRFRVKIFGTVAHKIHPIVELNRLVPVAVPRVGFKAIVAGGPCGFLFPAFTPLLGFGRIKAGTRQIVKVVVLMKGQIPTIAGPKINHPFRSGIRHILSGQMIRHQVDQYFQTLLMRPLHQSLKLFHAPIHHIGQIRIHIVIILNGIGRPGFPFNHIARIAHNPISTVIGAGGMLQHAGIPNMGGTQIGNGR